MKFLAFCSCVCIFARVEVVDMWPTVILSGISIATSPDETTMMVVYERTGKTTPKWCDKEKSRRDAIFVIHSDIQIWYADVRSLRAPRVMSAKHYMLWGSAESCVDGSRGRGGWGAARKSAYRFEGTSESRKPIPVPWSAVIDTRMHFSGKAGEEQKHPGLITIHVDWPGMTIYLSGSLRFSNESYFGFRGHGPLNSLEPKSNLDIPGI